MRNHDAGYAYFFQRVHQLKLGLLAQFFVQSSQRFVQQQEFGAFGERACQCHALLLPAGKLVRLAFGKLRHLHEAQHFLHACVDFVFWKFVLFQTECDVLFHGHVRKQGIALEHHVDGAVIRGEFGDVLPVQNNLPFGGGFHAGQHAQQRGFAAARTAQKGEDFVAVDV